jgi:electron transfer flavoprotein alpha subunit
MSSLFIYSDKPALASELVTLGNQLGLDATILVFSAEHTELYSDCGAKAMTVLEGDARLPENNARPLAAWLAQSGHQDPIVLVGATPTGRDLASRLAGYLDCSFAGDVSSVGLDATGTMVAAAPDTAAAGAGAAGAAPGSAAAGLDAPLRTKRTQYGGAVVLEEALGYPAVITVPAGRAEPASGHTPVVESATITPDSRVECIGDEPISKKDIDLAASSHVIGVGMGITSQEDMSLVQDLASVLDAGIGCTRGIAEERHWLPAEQYLGLSGLSIAPELYLAVGISGQVQHLVGIRDSKVIVAINQDENAAIFKAADYGIVGDLYEVVPALTELLRA